MADKSNRGGWALVALGHLVAWLPKDFDADAKGLWAPLLGNVSLVVVFSERSQRLFAELEARAAADEEWRLSIRDLFKEMREAVGHADLPDFAPWIQHLWPQHGDRWAAEPRRLLGRWLDLLEGEVEQRVKARQWAELVAQQQRIWWSSAASVVGEAAPSELLPLLQRGIGRARDELRRFRSTLHDDELASLRERVNQLETRLEQLEATQHRNRHRNERR